MKLGQLAFTAYVGHLLILALAVRPGPATLPGGLAVSALILVALIVFSLTWRRLVTRGPLEMLLSRRGCGRLARELRHPSPLSSGSLAFLKIP